MFAIRSFNHRPEDSPFTTRPTRTFLLVIDRTETSESGSNSRAAELLNKISKHRTLSVLSYGGTSAPASVERVADPFTKRSYPVDWIEVEKIDDGPAAMYYANSADSDGEFTTALLRMPFIEEEIGAIVSQIPGWDGPRSAAEVLHGALMKSAAAAVDADLLVSASESVLGVKKPFGAEIATCDFRAACLLVGLYLRTVGVYLVFSPNAVDGYELNAGIFYEAAALSICPSVGSLKVDLTQRANEQSSSSDGNDPDTLYDATLIRSTLSRLARSLAARDAMLRCCMLPAGEAAISPADQVSAELDSSMILMAGAFDALAQICDSALGIGASNRVSKWQMQQWRALVVKADSDFAEHLRDDSPSVRLIEMMGILRNEIHGLGVSGATYVSQDGAKSLVIRLRGEGAERFARKIEEAGLDSKLLVWERPYDLLIDPIALSQEFYPRLTDVLNQLAERTSIAMSQRHGMERSQEPLSAFPFLRSSVDVSSIEESVRFQMGFV